SSSVIADRIRSDRDFGEAGDGVDGADASPPAGPVVVGGQTAAARRLDGADGRSMRPPVMIEAVDDRAAEEAGDRYEPRQGEQREPEANSGPSAVRTATHFAQHQHQGRTNDGGGPEPSMRRQDPGIIGQVKTGQEPAEDAGSDCGEGAE